EPNADGSPRFPISTMRRIFLVMTLAAAVTATNAQQPPPQQPPPTRPPQPTDIGVAITGEGGQPPRIAVPEFIPLSKDAETVAMAKPISQLLFEDLAFEH